MRRGRRFQLLFNRDRVALILDCLEQARRTFSASGEKSEEELAEIEKLEHSFRQVLAYDETFKEIFKGGANEHNPSRCFSFCVFVGALCGG